MQCKHDHYFIITFLTRQHLILQTFCRKLKSSSFVDTSRSVNIKFPGKIAYKFFWQILNLKISINSYSDVNADDAQVKRFYEHSKQYFQSLKRLNNDMLRDMIAMAQIVAKLKPGEGRN